MSSLRYLAILLTGLVVFSSSPAHSDAQRAMNVKLPVMQGASNSSLSVSDFKGKVVLVDVWASWCAPCRLSFPRYENLYRQYANRGFVIVAINVDADLNAAKNFLAGFNVSFVVLRDDPALKKFVGPIGGIETMPTAYLVDKSGNVVLTKPGFTPGDKNKLAAEIEKLLLPTRLPKIPQPLS